MEEKIVIITAYFPIKSLKTHEFYLEKALPFLLKCKEHIILYTVAKYADIFRKIRGDLPLTLVIDSVDTDNLPISIPVKQILDEEIWNELASKLSNRNSDYLRNTNSSSFSVPLLQIWLSKAWFVSRTLELDEFKDFQVFLWQDIGSCRNETDQDNLTRWPSLQKLKLRGYEDDKLIFYQRRNHTLEKDLRPDLDINCVVAGATILGSRKAWGPVCEDIINLVKEIVEKYKDGVHDQTIYYYLCHKYPEKYKLSPVSEFSKRFPVGWYETFTQDVEEVNRNFTWEKKGTIFSAREFLFNPTAIQLAKQIKEINKTWWDVAVYPSTENKVHTVRYSDALYEEESFKRLRAHAFDRFNRGEFSYMFKRSSEHYLTCNCAKCNVRKLFDSPEIKNALGRIVGETVTELNETFCSKYETGDYLSIHHDKKKGDYAFVFQLTEDWKPAFGGLLHFYDKASKTVYETVNPIFNSLTIFKIKDVACTDHFVSANVSSHARYAFTGWFSVAKIKSLETHSLNSGSLTDSLVPVTFSPTPLCEIMTRHKSDKGNGWHNYTLVYDSLFKEKRQEELRVFELGLGTTNKEIKSNMGPNGRLGASLYGWEEYFTKSHIYGADIDKSILFTTSRISTFYCDQTDASCISELWAQPELESPFDLIIEDGLHTFEANKCFLENSLHKIKQDGYYIVEDILESQFSLFENQVLEWQNKYSDCTFRLVKIPLESNQYDNNLLVVHKKK